MEMVVTEQNIKEKQLIGFGDNTQSQLKQLLKTCKKHLKNYNEELIKKAFIFCVEAHKNKVRKSGEPFYKHPLAVAIITIKEMPLDQTSVIAALLHDVVNQSDFYSIKDIRSEFGATVEEIVSGISKIQHIESHNVSENENYRKLLLSLFKDVRIILIKIAEMLHNMRTIKYLEPEIQKKVANEVLEIYSPFANRFGLRNLKWELEDLAFKTINPDAYQEIKSKLHLTREEREEYIINIVNVIKHRIKNDDEFKDNKIKFKINGRAKHIYSIFNKIRNRGLPMEQLNDLFAVRIILDIDEISYCYLTYKIISRMYSVIDGTLKDYIANPKQNGYQSIHFAVRDELNNPFEVQIRTLKMHELSEKGVASHFNYKRGFLPAQSVLDDKNLEEWLNVVRKVFEKVGGDDSKELLLDARKKSHTDEIYVFTPTNEFKILPKDSTPLDFAYAIHSDIGKHCIGAKVNSRIEPMDYVLQSGDMIEILTSQKQKPRKDWLKIVITPRAKSQIHKYFKLKKMKKENKGKLIWEEMVKKLDIKYPNKLLLKMQKKLNFNSDDDFYLALATSGIDKITMFNLFKDIITEINNNKTSSGFNGILKENRKRKSKKIAVNYSSKLLFASCCNPLPGDKILGIISNDTKEIIIHRNNCPNIKELLNVYSSSIFEMDWDKINQTEFKTKFLILGEEKDNLLNDITTMISQMNNINIQSFNFDYTEEGFKAYITVQLNHIDDINTLFEKLKTINGIKSIQRIFK